MREKGPLEIIDQFTKASEKLVAAAEQNPAAVPLTEAEREAIRRGVIFFARIDAARWFFGWGKWVLAGLIYIISQWTVIADRVSAVWRGLIG